MFVHSQDIYGVPMTCLWCIALDPRDRVGVEKRQSHGMGKGGEQIESTKRRVPTQDSQVAFRGCGYGGTCEGRGVSAAWTSSAQLHTPSFFWPCLKAYGIIVPQPGTNLGPSAVKVQSPSHRTAREFPQGGKEGFPRRTWRYRGDPRGEKEPSVVENEGAAAGKTLWSGA